MMKEIRKAYVYRTKRLQAFYRIVVFRNFTKFTGKHLFWRLFLLKLQALGLQLHVKETPAQMFSCKYYKHFFQRTPSNNGFFAFNFQNSNAFSGTLFNSRLIECD